MTLSLLLAWLPAGTRIPLPSRALDPGLPGPGEEGFQPQWTGDYLASVQQQVPNGFFPSITYSAGG